MCYTFILKPRRGHIVTRMRSLNASHGNGRTERSQRPPYTRDHAVPCSALALAVVVVLVYHAVTSSNVVDSIACCLCLRLSA
jgi:hypothetical protein